MFNFGCVKVLVFFFFFFFFVRYFLGYARIFRYFCGFEVRAVACKSQSIPSTPLQKTNKMTCVSSED